MDNNITYRDYCLERDAKWHYWKDARDFAIKYGPSEDKERFSNPPYNNPFTMIYDYKMRLCEKLGIILRKRLENGGLQILYLPLETTINLYLHFLPKDIRILTVERHPKNDDILYQLQSEKFFKRPRTSYGKLPVIQIQRKKTFLGEGKIIGLNWKENNKESIKTMK